MVTFEIPDPEFSFSTVIKRKAEDLCKLYLETGVIKNIAFGVRGDVQGLENRIELEYLNVRNDSDRFLFILEIINHLNRIKLDYRTPRKGFSNMAPPQIITPKQDINFENTIDDILYFVYNLSSNSGYTFDKNAFKDEERDILNNKIDSILESLERLKVGQEVVFDFVDELKSDFESLKADLPLGKKRWYQRAAGIVVSYAGNKGADEVFDLLKPQLKDLLSQSPDMIDRLLSI